MKKNELKNREPVFKSKITKLKYDISLSNEKLSNVIFLNKAKPEIILLEKNKVRDFSNNLKILINDIDFKLKNIINEPFIYYFIEEIRISKYNNKLFTKIFFKKTFSKNILDEEKEELLYLLTTGKILDIFKSNLDKIK